MDQLRIAINDQPLTDSELHTLRLALGALELQLQSGSGELEVPISGEVDHLRNLSRLQGLIGHLDT